MFSVELSNNSLKALRKADAKMRERVHQAIAVLSSEPVPIRRFDVRKLSGYDGHYRYKAVGLQAQILR